MVDMEMPSLVARSCKKLYRGGSTTMFTLGFFVGIVLSPFVISVTLMMHNVNVKIIGNGFGYAAVDGGYGIVSADHIKFIPKLKHIY